MSAYRTGNKAALVERIKNHQKTVVSAPDAPALHISTGVAPAGEGLAPGVPPTEESQSSPIALDGILSIRLPEIPSPHRLPPIQIVRRLLHCILALSGSHVRDFQPVLPDHWNAATTKAAFEEATAAVPSAVEPALPKLVVIGGPGTYPDGSDPSLSSLEESTLSSPVENAVDTASLTPNKNGKGGILDDIAEDVGIPYLKDWKKSVFRLL